MKMNFIGQSVKEFLTNQVQTFFLTILNHFTDINSTQNLYLT